MSKKASSRAGSAKSASSRALGRTRIDLGENARRQMCELLNARLADALDLAGQCKQAHWNVKGPNFSALHELFDTLHANVNVHVDTIAERVVALGGTALGTVGIVAASTTLPAYPTDIRSGTDHADRMSIAFSTFAKAVRSAIDTADEAGDAVTADLFTEVAAQTDKDLWMLDAHLEA
ncbi:MAG: DNA starvation/stationary phase protection protein Dps [Beijerinckiaceae bacterium]|nr:DNA starvation/stationary phase protection protein Dps [Beijerinckiaceae bacterium]